MQRGHAPSQCATLARAPRDPLQDGLEKACLQLVLQGDQTGAMFQPAVPHTLAVVGKGRYLGRHTRRQWGWSSHDRERHAVRQHAPAHSVRSMTIASPASRASWPQRPPFARTRPAMLEGTWCCVAQLSQLQTVDRPRPAKNCTRVLLDVLPMTYHHHFSPRHLRI